jgi:hypothetical protein
MVILRLRAMLVDPVAAHGTQIEIATVRSRTEPLEHCDDHPIRNAPTVIQPAPGKSTRVSSPISSYTRKPAEAKRGPQPAIYHETGGRHLRVSQPTTPAGLIRPHCLQFEVLSLIVSATGAPVQMHQALAQGGE